jgi:2-C-methyl-D-erythritol 2,4-cyclodiphosphate synthase
MRVGWGFDAHRFGAAPPVRLAGVVADDERGLLGTSDGDVACHAVADAVLGAAALGDLGTHFPSSDPDWQGADSIELLQRVLAMLEHAGYAVTSIDLTIIAEDVMVAPIRESMRERLAAVIGISLDAVSVKATTTDGMGWLGRSEGIAAAAVAVIAER